MYLSVGDSADTSMSNAAPATSTIMSSPPPPVGPYRGAMGGVFGHICCAINMVQTHRAEADGSEKLNSRSKKTIFLV
jgi:hypothetical protein